MAKYIIKVFSIACMAVMIGAATLFGACSGGYKPEGDNWYKYGNVYRVFEKVDENPQHVDKMGLHSFTVPSAVGYMNGEVKVDTFFYDQSLFFDEPFLINKDGAAAIRKSLGLIAVPQNDDVFMCSYTRLFTYDGPVKSSDLIFKFTPSYEGDPMFTVVGFTSEADIYKFTYIDYDEKGNRVDEGEFSVIVSGRVVVDKFQIS